MPSRERQGSGFLFASRSDEEIFTPEMFSADQLAFYDAVFAFTEKEILPRRAELDRKQPQLMQSLLKQLGALGGLGLDVPEIYGGTGQAKVTSMLVSEATAREGSWTTTFGAHTGIGTLPIAFFGSDEQKARYLPKLATGEWIAAYALTEANSGSDALGAKAIAKLSDDGEQWILNGQKQWITNAGFADVFVAFAKIDGDKFSGFIVERNTPGVSIGAEENKLGIRGSSTCSLIFEDARIPVENLLGEAGKGHKIAFNILNVGRLKLGIMSVGGITQVLKDSLAYARTRKQFNKALIEFGAIREKFATTVAELYALEAMGYRAAGGIDVAQGGHGKAHMEALEEFSIEASILKVVGSEAVFRATDEALQVLGGYGYMEDFPVAKVFRDVRILRIFEGTNEVNRMLIPGTILKRAMKGQLPLLEAFQAMDPDQGKLPDLPVAMLDRAARQAQTLSVLLLGKAAMVHMQGLEEQQEILLALADICAGAYGLDTVRRRVRQCGALKDHVTLATAYAILELDRVITRATRLAIDVGGADYARALRPMLEPLPLSRMDALREVADLLVEKGAYWLGASAPRS